MCDGLVTDCYGLVTGCSFCNKTHNSFVQEHLALTLDGCVTGVTDKTL